MWSKPQHYPETQRIEQNIQNLPGQETKSEEKLETAFEAQLNLGIITFEIEIKVPVKFLSQQDIAAAAFPVKEAAVVCIREVILIIVQPHIPIWTIVPGCSKLQGCFVVPEGTLGNKGHHPSRGRS